MQSHIVLLLLFAFFVLACICAAEPRRSEAQRSIWRACCLEDSIVAAISSRLVDVSLSDLR